MKQPDLTKWRYTPELEGLLFFAQSLEELLFHHTFDGFKAPALNTHSRAYEFFTIAYRWYKGKVTRNAVETVIEELKWSIKNDIVLTKKAGSRIGVIYGRLAKAVDTPEELLSMARALLNVVGEEYWTDLKNEIVETVKDGRKKSEILELAKTFTAEIELELYDRQFLYRVNNEFFFDPENDPKQIYDPGQIVGFLKLFEREEKEWRVIFRGKEAFNEFSALSKNFGIEITGEKPDIGRKLEWADNFLGVNDSFPLYLIMPGVNAKECFSARDIAEYRLEAFINICSFYDHHAGFDWSVYSLVVEEKSRYLELLERRINPMVCGDVRADPSAKESIENAVKILRDKSFDEPSVRALHRVFEYHAAALKTLTNENKLLDLWVTLEGFIPVIMKKQDRIKYYIDILIPVLTLSYTSRLFNYMAESLKYGGLPVRAYINNAISTGDFSEKTTKIIVCEDMKDIRTRLYALLDGHPLLKYRVFRCQESFRSSNSIAKTLEQYRTLVMWHLRRIYNMRNQIVHTAESLPYLATLVENLHSYVDNLIEAVIKLTKTPESEVEIFDALIDLSIFSDSYLIGLEGENEICNSSNYKRLLFGEENPLAYGK